MHPSLGCTINGVQKCLERTVIDIDLCEIFGERGEKLYFNGQDGAYVKHKRTSVCHEYLKKC